MSAPSNRERTSAVSASTPASASTPSRAPSPAPPPSDRERESVLAAAQRDGRDSHAPISRVWRGDGHDSHAPISRVWRGWTTRAQAAAYQELVSATVLPGHERLDGYLGGCLLRRDDEEEVEFLVITRWESFAAIRKFAGEDYEQATIPPEAERLLERFDARALHYRQLYAPRSQEPAAGGAR